MPSLQKNINYEGDRANVPVRAINLGFEVPVYEYFVGVTEGTVAPKLVRRKLVKKENIIVPQAIDSEDYQLVLDDTHMGGKGDNQSLLMRMYFVQPRQNLDAFENLINDLTIKVNVHYFVGQDCKIGAESVEAIYFPDAVPVVDQDGAGTEIKNSTNPPKELKILFINKKSFLLLLKELPEHVNSFFVLLIISVLTEFSDNQPVLISNPPKELEPILARLDINRDDLLNTIKDRFTSLYDFPLTIPEIKTIDLGGTFKLKTSDGSIIKNTDFLLYTLSAEYSINGKSHRIGYTFPEPLEIHDNSVSFSFPKNPPIFQNCVSRIRVNALRGADTSPVWSAEFELDPLLKEIPIDLTNIPIEVTLSKQIVLTHKDKISSQDKRLRGQVLELSKKCPLKDLTVLVQAKIPAKDNCDEIWRIVGATTTDSSGNFSMPYPFGIYTDAQAITSLTPNHPACIPIINVRDGNQTISDDFLYLLVQDMDCPHIENGEDCDCHTAKKASRLPDYADLIESDEYTQDIGGNCVNLSTPNRTLSEFNYQAIVRTSDPDVANYTLIKQDVVKTHSEMVPGPMVPGPMVPGMVPGPEIFGMPTTIPGMVPGPMVPGPMVPGPMVSVVETSYILEGGAKAIERESVGLNNPVAWQDAPEHKENLSLYQAVTVATGHILHYKSLFKADGYSLGDLIYSLPLAPGQKKQIVTFDASHTLQGAESQVLSQGERLIADIASERDITNQLGGSITERMRGSSSANTSGISAGFGTGGSGSGGTGAYGGSGSAVLGVAGGVANANSDASSDSSRNISQYFGEKLRQSIMQNAESYRQQNASVVTTVQEGQRYGVTSEVVANHNHCHALTMMYFEVLRHYAIFQELAGVEECVFVPLLMTNFTTQNIYKWRDVLAQFLLSMPSETYLQPFSFTPGSGRQHPLLKAFDANERIKTQYVNVDFPEGSYDNEQINFIKGEIGLRVNLQRPKTRYDRIMSLPIITNTTTTSSTGGAVAGAGAGFSAGALIGSLVGALVPGVGPIIGAIAGGAIGGTVGADIGSDKSTIVTLVKKQIFDSFMQLDANYETVPPAQCIRVTSFQPSTFTIGGISISVSGADFFDKGLIDKTLWTAYAKLLDPTKTVYDVLDYYFKDKLIAEWDEIYYNDIAPVIFDKIVDSINVDLISTDVTSIMRYRGGERLMLINLNGTTNNKRNQFPLNINIFSSSADIRALKNLVTLTVEKVTIFYSTAHYNGVLFSGYSGDDLLDGADLYIPENSEEKRNPRKEDAYLVSKLIEHLNSNLEYYNKLLWYNLDPDRRFMLLDGFNIQIFDQDGTRIPKDQRGLRSLASVVKNDLITVTGNSLVFPVAAGYKVSNDYILEKTEIREETDDEKQKKKVTLLDHYKPLTPIKPYRISVPSRGVFAEAIQGACNACEKIETDRLQDWNKFPNTDEPTAISPVTPPTVGITDWRASFKDFAAPMINIQNAPADPTPGAGLAGLSELLGQSGVFKDITGLEGNQRNVLQTYLSNQENAKAFAQMAKEMAMQSHNTQNSGKIMDTLKGAKGDGALNQEEYSTLVKDHLQQQIDGGQTKQAELEMEKEANPSPLTKAAIDAAKAGKPVTAEKIDNDGTLEKVDINQAGGGTLKSIIEREIAALIETAAAAGSTSLVGDPMGPLDLSKAMKDYLDSLAVPGGGTCVAVSLIYFTSAMRKLGIGTLTVPTDTGSIELPSFATQNGTVLSARSIAAIWFSNTAATSWNRLPTACRGAGAPGALLYADLVENRNIKTSKVGWPTGMTSGAHLQLWRSEEEYKDLRDNGVEPTLGHSCVFQDYVEGEASKILVSDQMGVAHEVKYPYFGLKFVMAANLSKARLFILG